MTERPSVPANRKRPKDDTRRTNDDSPVPPVMSVTVRPPRPATPKRGPSKVSAQHQTKSSSWLRWLQLLSGIVVVLAASVAVAWGARRYMMSSPRFAVRTVLVDGTKRLSADDVARAGGLDVGKNIFALDLNMAGAAITADPWIEKATVVRKLPSTIQVTVIEREARALAVIGSELYLCTADGELFKKFGDSDPVDLPVVSGIDSEQVVRDRPGIVLAIKRALDVLVDLERAGIERRYPVQELHIAKDGSMVFTIGKDGIALHLGQPPYGNKIAQAQRVLTEISKRKATPLVLFLDNDAHPERVVVRMK